MRHQISVFFLLILVTSCKPDCNVFSPRKIPIGSIDWMKQTIIEQEFNLTIAMLEDTSKYEFESTTDIFQFMRLSKAQTELFYSHKEGSNNFVLQLEFWKYDKYKNAQNAIKKVYFFRNKIRELDGEFIIAIDEDGIPFFWGNYSQGIFWYLSELKSNKSWLLLACCNFLRRINTDINESLLPNKIPTP